MAFRKTQTLLEQAQDCVDAALDQILRDRDELMEVGISAFSIGTINAKLAGVVGDLSTVRRLMPGYNRTRVQVEEMVD